jgi:hypothetical protein
MTGPDRGVPGSGPPAGPRRPPPGRSALPVVAVIGVVLVALGVGIPVAMLTAPPDPAAPAAPASSSASVTTPERPPEGTAPVGPPSPTQQHPAPSIAPAPVTGPPAGLSADQAALWDELAMQGVDSRTCRGYPEGERVTNSVVASIQCTVEDSSISEPITYYRFPGPAAVAEYLQLRASEITAPGDCADGQEQDISSWNTDGVDRGSIVCVRNTKEGTTFFKIVWSSSSDDSVAVVQGTSPSATFQWWYANGGSQFSE